LESNLAAYKISNTPRTQGSKVSGAQINPMPMVPTTMDMVTPHPPTILIAPLTIVRIAIAVTLEGRSIFFNFELVIEFLLDGI
jgi:hypothetical protein